MRKNNAVKIVLALSLVVILALWILLFRAPKDTNKPLVLGGKTINITRAISKSQQELGLANKATISDSEGMLFVFKNPSTKHCIWMKDMKFAIDVLWFDKEKTFVDSVENVQPDSYPKTFCPSRPATYILEVKSDSIGKNRWKIGQQATF